METQKEFEEVKAGLIEMQFQLVVVSETLAKLRMRVDNLLKGNKGGKQSPPAS